MRGLDDPCTGTVHLPVQYFQFARIEYEYLYEYENGGSSSRKGSHARTVRRVIWVSHNLPQLAEGGPTVQYE